MKKPLLLIATTLSFLFLLANQSVSAQTCTITGTSPISWSNASPPSCVEGGNANSYSILVVPSGIEIDFDDSGDTWSGTRIVLGNGGTLTISFSGQITLNTDVFVESGGFLNIETKLNLGSAGGCGYDVILESATANLNVGDGASDRLNICGVLIATGGGGLCNPYPAGPIPYCEPASGGFVGPLGLDQTGINPTLPVKINDDFIGRQVDNNVKLTWSTSMEEDFSEFVVEHSTDGVTFREIGAVKGQGKNLYDVTSSYSFKDVRPFLGRNYYRLKAVDIDNSFEYSKKIKVDVTGEKSFSVYPNPSIGGEVFFESNFHPSESDRLVVTDQLGVQVANVPATGPRSSLAFKDQLKAGVYFVRYIGADHQSTIRLVVAR